MIMLRVIVGVLVVDVVWLGLRVLGLKGEVAGLRDVVERLRVAQG